VAKAGLPLREEGAKTRGATARTTTTQVPTVKNELPLHLTPTQKEATIAGLLPAALLPRAVAKPHKMGGLQRTAERAAKTANRDNMPSVPCDVSTNLPQSEARPYLSLAVRYCHRIDNPAPSSEGCFPAYDLIATSSSANPDRA
jgi:hypothetical protein